MKGQILGDGLMSADDPIFREGWCVGVPLLLPERPAAPRPEPPPADSNREVGALQERPIRRRRPR